MNDEKLNKIFAAAREETPVAPTEGFDRLVMQAVRSEARRGNRPALEQLEAWFPRLAWAAAVVIVLCVAGELAANAQWPGLTDGMEAVSQQWLLNGGSI